ncbi:isochorismate synthase [Corynebacterium kozikiae]|uniref:isochorismate synthase n=1 Tax=Corynebacterium kozikiae TaxID=2968469 RepID=UPI00211CB995|nr:isochorismate synthase [Corynebacterium sp. 76QC2CO]MCQ9343407.1 isochorismate synthase [Corynebacterium sp. 76QC2CO]
MSSAPATAPDFLLSRAHGSVRTQGARRTFNSIAAAKQALSQGADMVVGAIPFNPEHPCALTEPERIIREDGPLEPHAYYRHGEGAALHASLIALDPPLEEHERRVAAAVATIKKTALQKVVLARSVKIAFDPPVDPRLIAARLIDLSIDRDGFIADLTPAGPAYQGHWLVGSSPEVLVKKQGSTVSAYPLAGSLPRVNDPVQDRINAEELRRSTKNLAEHAFVTAHLRNLLQPLCSSLSIPSYPELTRTNEMWHLATPISGTLSPEYAQLTALDLAQRCHPTPAICGTPTDAARCVIEEAEAPRGFYAGAVGWCDSSGDGEFMVAIRCAEVSAGGHSAVAWAGGGIVAHSDPAEEVAETSAKLRTIMNALGLRS